MWALGVTSYPQGHPPGFRVGGYEANIFMPAPMSLFRAGQTIAEKYDTEPGALMADRRLCAHYHTSLCAGSGTKTLRLDEWAVGPGDNEMRGDDALMIRCVKDAQTATTATAATTDPGVVINGVTWATRNVGMPGTFVASPEDPGMFYQWNRRVGWSSTDPMVNSDGGKEWPDTDEYGDRWEKENDPCPPGWHVPTEEDVMRSLMAKNVKVTAAAKNGTPGFWVGRLADRIFMPSPQYDMRLGCNSAKEKGLETGILDKRSIDQVRYAHWGPGGKRGYRDFYVICTTGVAGQYRTPYGALMVRCVKNWQ